MFFSLLSENRCSVKASYTRKHWINRARYISACKFKKFPQVPFNDTRGSISPTYTHTHIDPAKQLFRPISGVGVRKRKWNGNELFYFSRPSSYQPRTGYPPLELTWSFTYLEISCGRFSSAKAGYSVNDLPTHTVRPLLLQLGECAGSIVEFINVPGRRSGRFRFSALFSERLTAQEPNSRTRCSGVSVKYCRHY